MIVLPRVERIRRITNVECGIVCNIESRHRNCRSIYFIIVNGIIGKASITNRFFQERNRRRDIFLIDIRTNKCGIAVRLNDILTSRSSRRTINAHVTDYNICRARRPIFWNRRRHRQTNTARNRFHNLALIRCAYRIRNRTRSALNMLCNKRSRIQCFQVTVFINNRIIGNSLIRRNQGVARIITRSNRAFPQNVSVEY